MKTIVISAVNLVEGGPYTVLRDCVAAAPQALPGWRIVALVNDVRLIDTPGVATLAFPEAKRAWVNRARLEWHGFVEVSQALNADLWLSLHDITPRVHARRLAVYCHNPSPFTRARLRDALFEPKFLAFNQFYSLLYRINIRRNDTVVVQQQWLREEFQRRYRPRRILVAHPQPSPDPTGQPARGHRGQTPGEGPVFLYPALPRCFKNFELIGDAVARLVAADRWRARLRWTIDGTENRYSRWLFRKYRTLPGIEWIGRRTLAQMADEYAAADCLIFPSRLETWGLPITEAKRAGLPMLVADLPYAHETVGSHDRVTFVDVDDATDLAARMHQVIDGTPPFTAVTTTPPGPPFAADWTSLLHDLTAGL